jgi:hypothetical protein
MSEAKQECHMKRWEDIRDKRISVMGKAGAAAVDGADRLAFQ